MLRALKSREEEEEEESERKNVSNLCSLSLSHSLWTVKKFMMRAIISIMFQNSIKDLFFICVYFFFTFFLYIYSL